MQKIHTLNLMILQELQIRRFTLLPFTVLMLNICYFRGFQTREGLFSKLVTSKASTPVTKRVWSNKSVYFCGALPTDFNSSSSPIINGVQIRVEFTLSNNNFLLQTSYPNAKFELEEVIISVPCAEVSDELALSIQKHLEKEPAVVQFRRRNCIPFVIPKNSTVFLSDSKFIIFLFVFRN